MLLLADIFFHILHLAIIGYNLFGWLPRLTRRLHRLFIGVTAFCWLAVGWWVGSIGYCPLTDWHWRIKEAQGELTLPNSYIDYLLQLFNLHAHPQRIDTAVGLIFAALIIVTIALWRNEHRKSTK